MSDQLPLGEETDRPIIIQGGGSVDITVPENFNEQVGTNYAQAATGAKEKKFKNDRVNLVSLQIDEDTPITLNRNSKITITCR